MDKRLELNSHSVSSSYCIEMIIVAKYHNYLVKDDQWFNSSFFSAKYRLKSVFLIKNYLFPPWTNFSTLICSGCAFGIKRRKVKFCYATK